MQKSEKEKLVARLRRAADAQRRAHSGNLYHEGIAQGLDDAAGILGKVRCEEEVKADWRERKVYEWIKMSDADRLYYCCSRCGEEGEREWKYCPHCGASMVRGEEDG